MKVLLLGEFSSLHKYIKLGLIEQGHEVTLAASGDGWKKISGADFPLINYSGKGFKNLYSSYVEPCLIARKFEGYDVVQLLDPLPYPWIINTLLIKMIKKRNKCLSLVSAGGDYAVVRAYLEGKFEYNVCDYDKSYLKKYDKHTISGWIHCKNAEYVECVADVIIPIHYDYMVGYNTKKLSKVIPFGLDLKEIQYHENIIGDKIVFFHGLNNELKKGTQFIRKALNRLKTKYSDKVEIIIDGHMPFDKYIEIMKRANVVIDQCCAYGYGINAGIAMAQGKVVLSGAREETIKALGIEYCPIISIKPDVEELYAKLEELVLNPERIKTLGYLSRQFVEKVHDYEIIANKYIEIWRGTGKI